MMGCALLHPSYGVANNMRSQIIKYTAKLLADRSALPGCVAIAAQDDSLITEGPAELADLAGKILARLNCLGLVVARPALSFADFLVARAPREESAIVPQD